MAFLVIRTLQYRKDHFLKHFPNIIFNLNQWRTMSIIYPIPKSSYH